MNRHTQKRKSIVTILTAGFAVIFFSSCANFGDVSKLLKKAKDSLAQLSGIPTSMTIANVTVDSSQSSSTPVTTVYISQTDSLHPLTDFCSIQSSGTINKNCDCLFRWTESNQSTGSNVTINREVRSALVSVQPYLTTCNAPEAYANEIPNGTQIRISVIPRSGNNSGGFATDEYRFTKGTTVAGDFFDSEGRAFNDILRYSCYEKTAKGLGVRNKILKATSSSGEEKPFPLASGFCPDGVTAVEGCEASAPAQYTAQSYYYDLSVPSQIAGIIKSENQKYVCPKVREPIDGNGSIGTEARFYPLDKSYSLAQAYSSDFSVPVQGPTVLGVTNDPQTATTSCSVPGDTAPSQTQPPNPTSIAYKCQGFAMVPNDNGTCPSFKDANNHTRLTYRLRRFIAQYPPQFKASGKVIEQAPEVNMIYILDRPVDSGDPAKPYTMMGPKPCPFAYLDHNGALNAGWEVDNTQSTNAATNTACGDPIECVLRNTVSFNRDMRADGRGIPVYSGTYANSSSFTYPDATGSPASMSWNDKSIDGTALPNIDDPAVNSCAAIVPIVQYTPNNDPWFIALGTTHPTNTSTGLLTGTPNTVSIGGGSSVSMTKLYIRPQKAWFPHYVEDTAFRACAPQAQNAIDPPLHFSRDSDGNVGWCSESYPSQNNRVASIDLPYSPKPSDAPLGYFRPFTSHVVKKASSAACTATLPDIPTTYPATNGPAGPCGNGVGLSNATNNYMFVGLARHPAALTVDQTAAATYSCSDVTCDRTVVNDNTGAMDHYPLLANAQDTEAVLRADPNYNCTITYDDYNGKAGVRSPASGCCNSAVVQLSTGAAGGTYDNAHLEPSTACQIPTY